MNTRKTAAQWPAVFDTVYAMPERLRPALTDFVLTSPRHSDLVNAFPYAAVALATQRGNPARRGEALWLLEKGAGLKAIGKALDLPGWTRRIHPMATGIDLPEGIDSEPGCPALASLGRRLPADPRRQASWLFNLNRVFAYPDKALRRWLILRAPLCSHFIGPMIDFMAAYKFYSDSPGLAASATLSRPWDERLSWGEATALVQTWTHDAAVEALWRGSGLSQVEPEPFKVGKYKIIPITTQQALEAEAERMENCLRTYWVHVLTGASRLFAIAGPRSSRAVFDVRTTRIGTRIFQIKGKRNKAASRPLRAAANAWVEDGLPGAPSLKGRARCILSCAGPWFELWTPFLEAHEHFNAPPASERQFPRVGLLHTELSVLEHWPKQQPARRRQRNRPPLA